MRGIETIDSELRLLVAIRRLVREEEVRTPNARRIDQLLDERAAANARAGYELLGIYGNYPPPMLDWT
jgi:hypothetical protein